MSEQAENRIEALRKIRDEVWNFKESPLYAERVCNRAYPVIGEGSHDARIMFIGEAPGRTEAQTGRPFAGAAGKLLDELHNPELKQELLVDFQALKKLLE